MPSQNDPIATFDRFIAVEREYFENEQNNRMAFALNQPGRYMNFLVIVKDRHDELQAQVIAASNARKARGRDRPGTEPLTWDKLEQWREESDLQNRMHLEIETFVDMAYIGLTKTAQFAGWYFTNEMRFESHKKFVDRGPEYCRENNLQIPEGLFDAATAVLDRVTEPRSHQIVHEFMPSVAHGTSWGPEGSVRRATTKFYPSKGSTNPPALPPVDEAYGLISDYVRKFIQLVTDNRLSGKYADSILDVPGRPLFDRLAKPEA